MQFMNLNSSWAAYSNHNEVLLSSDVLQYQNLDPQLLSLGFFQNEIFENSTLQLLNPLQALKVGVIPCSNGRSLSKIGFMLLQFA